MTQQIRFVPSSKLALAAVPAPKPAKNYIPDWWKKVPSFQGGKPDYLSSSQLNTTVKHCMPYFDALTGGYIQELWTDVFIEIEKDKDGVYLVNVRSSLQIPGLEPIRIRNYDKETNRQPFPDGYYPLEFTWGENWCLDTPDGWSTLYTHPMNRYDLPFITLSGLVDTDRGKVNTEGSIPFYIKEGFSGLIPAGTPLFHMIPVKREDWESDVESFDEYRYFRDNSKMRKFFSGGYRKNIWHKKRYD